MPKRDQEGRGGFRNAFPKRRNNSTSYYPDAIPSSANANANANLDLKELERSLAKEFHDKPRDERERLVDEFHGVSSRAVPESEEMIASALEAFQQAIDNTVPEREKGAYHKGCDMESTYIQSTPFRLKFLRAELFDAKKAALRYVRNLEYLLEKFGEFALMRQLYMTDLNKDEMMFFKKGFIQILPFRDSVGRRIIVNLGSYGGLDFSMETKEKVGAYLLFGVLSEDVTTQRKGAISLGLLNEDAIEGIRGVEVSSIRRFVQAMPIRYSGYHTCVLDTFRSRVLKALALTFFLGEIRLMSRFHIGTQIERDYELRTFGIPTEYIPLSCTGTIKDAYHKSYIKMRTKLDYHRKEEADDDYQRYYSPNFVPSPFHAIECPEVDSFLVRRNGVAWNYPGNIRLRARLEEKLSDQKRLRGEFVRAITEEFIEWDIPMLVFDDGNGWYTRVTSKQDIHKQVLYIMREIRKRKRVKENMKEKESSNSKECATDRFQGLTDSQCTMMDSCFTVSYSIDTSMQEMISGEFR